MFKLLNKIPILNKFTKYGSPKGFVQAWVTGAEFWPRVIMRTIQGIFAFGVLWVYAWGVHHDRTNSKSHSVEFIFALGVIGLSIITCLTFALFGIVLRPARFWAWDLVLSGLWGALVIIFGLRLKNAKEEEEFHFVDVSTLRRTKWVDLTISLLWATSGIYGILRTFIGEKAEAKYDETEKQGFEMVGGAAGKGFDRVAGKFGRTRSNSYEKEASWEKANPYEKEDSQSFDRTEEKEPRYPEPIARVPTHHSEFNEKSASYGVNGSRFTEKLTDPRVQRGVRAVDKAASDHRVRDAALGVASFGIDVAMKKAGGNQKYNPRTVNLAGRAATRGVQYAAERGDRRYGGYNAV